MPNSPRYTGYLSGPYTAQLTDDTGAPLNLTGVDTATGFSFIMQNVATLQFQYGLGAWTITDAVNGKVEYQWTTGDLASAGTFLVYITVQLPGEPYPRAFDPDTVVVKFLQKGNAAIVSTQDVNLIEVNGAQVSSANPVPVSGPVQVTDGGSVTLGAKADAAITDPTVSASEIALLKGLVKILALQGVAITGVSGALADGAIATLGTEGDAAWSGSGPGTGIAILKKIEALLAATQTIAGTITEANSSSINTHVANIDADSASIVTNTSTTATNTSNIETHAANIDTNTGNIETHAANIDTNTSNIETHASAIDTNTSNASTVLGTTSDAAWSLSGNATIDAVAKKIALLLSGILQVEQADLSTSGTINAAQSTEGTPVSGATVQLALGEGQSSWKAQLLSGGSFTSATTLVADKSLDNATTWLTSSFKVGGSVTNTTVQSIVGPGPLELTGNASGVTHVRVRCSVLGGGESIAVTLRGSAGVSDIGLASSIPAGSNTIGNVNAQGSPDSGTTFHYLKTTSDGTQVANATLQSGTNLAGSMVRTAKW